jgi:hypothetical protein
MEYCGLQYFLFRHLARKAKLMYADGAFERLGRGDPKTLQSAFLPEQ